MEIKRKLKKAIVSILTLFLIGIYGSFLTMDIHSGFSDDHYSKAVKYICILVLFFMTLLIGKDGHSKKSTWLLRLALFLTVIADFCIGILGQFIAGIGVFFFVQVVFILRHKVNFKFNKNELVSCLIIYSLVCIIIYFIGKELLSKGETATFIAIVIYAATLATSLWMAVGTLWRGFFSRTISWFIALGMCFFFLCDLNVGLSNALPKKIFKSDTEKFILFENPIRLAKKLEDEKSIEMTTEVIKIPFTMQSITGILVWLFYLPAQMLLVLSGFKLSFLRSANPLIADQDTGD